MALAGAAVAFTSLYLAAGAFMPLLVLYQERWNLPAGLMTLTFAVFAGGFLIALLALGSLSDYVGRRPVLLGALTIELVSNITFLVAPDIRWVIVGRVLQGSATGMATGAFTAILVELAPPSRPKIGAILGSIGLTGGLAVGSLLAGAAIQVSAASNSIIFIVLAVLTALGIGVIALSPETAAPTPGALRSLLPRIAVPATVRREFVAAVPVIAAVWMLSGLTGGLAPSMVRSVFHLNSGLLNGVSGFIAPAMSAVIGLATMRIESRRSLIIGIFATIAGAIGIAGGAILGSLAVMIAGQAVAGAAFGAAFTAALRLILPLTPAHQRAGVASTIYLVSYTAFGVPIVIAGRVADIVGLVPTVCGYSAVTLLSAAISLGGQYRLRRRVGVQQAMV